MRSSTFTLFGLCAIGFLGLGGTAQAAARPDLALNKVCKATSVEGTNIPNKATDGKLGQGYRWGSNYLTDKNKDSAWIFVDLGAKATLDSIAIYWEHSGAARYSIQVWNSEVDTPSYDDNGWTTILTDTTLTYQAPPVDMCLSFLKIAPVSARYVRVRCYKRLFNFGYSIMELQAYGTMDVTSIRNPVQGNQASERPSVRMGREASIFVSPGDAYTPAGRKIAPQYQNPF